jgi:hypothetical protein
MHNCAPDELRSLDRAHEIRVGRRKDGSLRACRSVEFVGAIDMAGPPPAALRGPQGGLTTVGSPYGRFPQ